MNLQRLFLFKSSQPSEGNNRADQAVHQAALEIGPLLPLTSLEPKDPLLPDQPK